MEIAASAAPVVLPTLAIPAWVWALALALIIAITVGLGFEATRSGHKSLMFIGILLGGLVGIGFCTLYFTNLLKVHSTAALEELEDKYSVSIFPRRDGLFAAPVVPNSSVEVAVKTQAGTTFDCMIVTDEEIYSMFCFKDGNLRPVEEIVGE